MKNNMLAYLAVGLYFVLVIIIVLGLSSCKDTYDKSTNKVSFKNIKAVQQTPIIQDEIYDYYRTRKHLKPRNQ